VLTVHDGLSSAPLSGRAEIDVYLSQGLADRLYLLQYPLRPVCRPYVNGTGGAPAVKVKPEQDKLEMVFDLKTDAETYDDEMGKQLSDLTLTEDGPNSKVPMYPSGQMDTQVLRSSKVPMRTHYLAGIFREDGLHLTPLKAILQLRPTFDHINEAENRKIEKSKGGKKEEEEFKPVNIRLARIESERAQAARIRSHGHMQEQSDAEPWIEVDYVAADTAQAEGARTEMQSQGMSTEIEFNATRSEWLTEMYCDQSEAGGADGGGAADEGRVGRTEDVVVKDESNGGVSLHEIREMSLTEQVRMLMKQAQIMQYKTLKSFLSCRDDALILAALQACAWYLCGAWVVKSVEIAPTGNRTTNFGSNGRSFVRARDFMLLLFQKGNSIVPKEIIDKTGFASQDVREILRKFSKVHVQSDGYNRWEFNFQQDREFDAEFAKVLKREKELWAGTRGDGIMAALSASQVNLDDESTGASDGGGRGGTIRNTSAGSASSSATAAASVLFVPSKPPAELLAIEIEASIIAENPVHALDTDTLVDTVANAALTKLGVVSLNFIIKVLELLPTDDPNEDSADGAPTHDFSNALVVAALARCGTDKLNVAHRQDAELYVIW
jgi:DNA-directed RNA polymerase-3 subunit RPC5